jgi:hypothetical protein
VIVVEDHPAAVRAATEIANPVVRLP